MRNKLPRVFITLMVVMLCMAAFSITALAYADEDEQGTASSETTEMAEPEETTESAVTAESAEALTPDGNLTLADDIESGDKEFITVQTKDGNTFYLIIDHASSEDNVYFLNMVDEEDLLALIDDEDFVAEYADSAANDSSETEAAAETADEAASQSSEEQETQKESTNSGPIAAAVLAAVILGAAVWLFKSRKSKKSAKSKTALDDYDFGEDEDKEPEVPDEEAEREDE